MSEVTPPPKVRRRSPRRRRPGKPRPHGQQQPQQQQQSQQPRENNRGQQLAELERQLKIKFKNRKLFDQALTHPSYAHEKKEEQHNERLEFLGDAFLGLVISQLLYNRNPKANEGELTKTKSYLVSAKFLFQLAEQIQLGKYLQIGRGEKPGSLPSSSMQADAFEALLGALFLDQGYDKGSKLIERLYLPHLKISEQEDENSKGVLQEILQRKYKEHPHYEVVAEYGPDHSKEFEIKVLFRGKVFGIGKGKSKKDAEKAAAKEALTVLGRD